MAFITAVWGCGGNRETQSKEGADKPERAAVNLEGFSFIYQGPPVAHFSEAPVLAQRVATGELPPVEDRLPDEPLIIPPIERIGQYGGTWRRGFTGLDTNNMDRIIHDHVIYFDFDGYTLMPHIAKGWDISEDGRTFTFYLRKGMKWSDGAPFTADDFVFAFEDVTLNKDLNPVKPSHAIVDGQLCKCEKIDETTIRYTFHKSNYVFIEKVAGLFIGGQFTRGGGAPLYAPRHYLKQFLPKYTPLEELKNRAKAAGDESWKTYFLRIASPHKNRGLPVVGPWKMVTPLTSEIYSLERNPYYYAIDPEGNQLPYIDKIEMLLFEDVEVFNARAIAGEVDMQHRHILLDKVPLIKRESDKGDHRLLLWPNLGGSDAIIYVNQTWVGDPEIVKWLRSRDFRKALSLAIDREEINELIFLGIGKPRAFLPLPNNPYYPGPEYERKNAVRDLEQSNTILDALGLDKRDSEGYRLRTDNRGRLNIRISVAGQTFVNFDDIAELLVNHWKDVGLNIKLNIEAETLYGVRATNNEHQLSMGVAGGSENPWTYPVMTIPVSTGAFAPRVGSWYISEGKKGKAPSGGLKRLVEIYEEGNSLPKKMRTELGKELWRIHSDNLYVIGTVAISRHERGCRGEKTIFAMFPMSLPIAQHCNHRVLPAPNNSFLRESDP